MNSQILTPCFHGTQLRHIALQRHNERARLGGLWKVYLECPSWLRRSTQLNIYTLKLYHSCKNRIDTVAGKVILGSNELCNADTSASTTRPPPQEMSQNVYPYEPLTSGDVFRYVVLQPGSGHEPLKCSLQTANIADTSFEAISYVWGTNPIKDKTITCDTHLMTITSSLSNVLRRVRHPFEPRSLWADGISINQANLQEKGHQVGLMGKIYRATSCTLVYIGADNDAQGPAVHSLLQDMDAMIRETFQTIDVTWDSFPYPDEEDSILLDPRWNAFYQLLAQDWFDRGWVVQEAALATQAQVIWGNTVLDWDIMMRVYVWLSTRATRTYQSLPFAEYRINSHLDLYLETHQQFGKAFYDELSWGTPSILRTLNCAKELDLKDPRDRIYAFMDLSQWSEHHIRINPNYFKPHLETYQEFASQYIHVSKDARLLDYVVHDNESLSQSPSWVPRWDIPTWSVSQSCEVTSRAQPRSGNVDYPKVLEDGLLKVRGVVIDTVRYASEVLEWDTTSVDTLRDIWDQISSYQMTWPYDTLEDSSSRRIIAFLDSLTAGTFDGTALDWRKSRGTFARQLLERNTPTQEHQMACDSATHIADVQDLPDMVSDVAEDTDLYFDHMRSRTDKRKFILTARGYMGLAPGTVSNYDACGIVFGCKTPCILRRADREHHYTFLGATFLVGRKSYDTDVGGIIFCNVLSEEDSKDWVEWDVEEQDIYLC